MNKREFVNQFPPLHAKFIFHALSNALSSTKFEWETVGLQSLDKLRIYNAFFLQSCNGTSRLSMTSKSENPLPRALICARYAGFKAKGSLDFELPLTTSRNRAIKKNWAEIFVPIARSISLREK